MVQCAPRASNGPDHLGLCALQYVIGLTCWRITTGCDLFSADCLAEKRLLTEGEEMAAGSLALLAIGETVTLLTLPLHLVGVSIDMEAECQQNDSLADG